MTGWQGVENLLAVRLDSLGDVLMTEPAIRAVRETLDCRVTLLTSPEGAAVGELLPAVDEVIAYRAPWMKSSPLPRGEDFALIERLTSRRFDAAIIFTVFSQNPLPAALTAHLAGIPRRLAYCRENPYHLLTDWQREEEPGLARHEVQRQLDLVAAIGCTPSDDRMQLSLESADRAAASEVLSAHSIDGRAPFVVVHPGASASSRRYDPSHFAAVARALQKEHGLPVVLTGSDGESPLLSHVRTEAGGGPVLIKSLELPVFAALLETAAVLVSNNTGPAHVAAAVGTPVVDLYALTNPQHTPWRVASRVLNHDVECRWCYSSVCRTEHHACIDSVVPSEVVAAVLELMRD